MDAAFWDQGCSAREWGGVITKTKVKIQNQEVAPRLRHKKNKGVRPSHASSRNSEAIDVWKVARHPPSRRVVACDDYSFKNAIVFFLLQCNVRTVIKLKLEHSSKEYQSFTAKKHEKGWPKCFLRSYRDFTKFAMI